MRYASEKLTVDEQIKKLKEIISELPEPSSCSTSKAYEIKKDSPCPGEVWLTAQPENDIDAWTLQVLILSKSHCSNLVVVVPIIPDAVSAGPEDKILPREMLGYEAVASYELKATISIDKLDSCMGGLSEKHFEILRNGKLKRGMTYIDKEDYRYKEHVDICERITMLQFGLLDNVKP